MSKEKNLLELIEQKEKHLLDKPLEEAVQFATLQKSKESVSELDLMSETAEETNRELLKRLLSDNADTEYGRKYGFGGIKDADEYRKVLPLTTYEDYEPYIDRMTEKGEKNLLTTYPVIYYASTSGTSGQPKKIPVSDRGLELFRNYSCAFFSIISEYYKSTHYHGTPTGRLLLMLNLSKTILADGTPFGAISAAALDDFKMKMMEYLIAIPNEVALCSDKMERRYFYARYALMERNITGMVGAYIPSLMDIVDYIWNNREILVRDIRTGTIDPGILVPEELRSSLEDKLDPDPKRADELEAAFEKGFDSGIIKRIWPKMSFVSAVWGGNFYVYARKLQMHTGKAIPYYTASYVASEGIFGIARHPFDETYCLLPHSCFYEFIPVNEDGPDQESGNPKTVLLDEVEEGKAYEMVITNQSGFYRYRMGDVVRVTGFYNETPMVSFLYRTRDVVSLVGEKLTEDHLHCAVHEFEKITGINVVDYCMYSDKDGDPPRYIIFLEPISSVPDEKKEEAAKILGEELAKASTSYAHYVMTGELSSPEVIFLEPQTFLLYREMKMYRLGVSENQIKPIRALRTEAEYKFFMELED